MIYAKGLQDGKSSSDIFDLHISVRNFGEVKDEGKKSKLPTTWR